MGKIVSWDELCANDGARRVKRLFGRMDALTCCTWGTLKACKRQRHRGIY